MAVDRGDVQILPDCAPVNSNLWWELYRLQAGAMIGVWSLATDDGLLNPILH